MGNGVFLCDGVGAPFVFGLFRPKIYLSGGLSEEETELILAHERTHLKRGDPIWKLYPPGPPRTGQVHRSRASKQVPPAVSREVRKPR